METVSSSHNDTIMIMNIGLILVKDSYGGMAFHVGGDSSLLGQIGSKQMVKYFVLLKIIVCGFTF